MNEGLSANQIETFKNQLERIKRELNGEFDELTEGEGEERSIFELLGFNFNDNTEKAFSDALEFAKTQLLEFAKLRSDLARQNLDEARRETDGAQQALDRQLELRAQGLANRADEAAKELAISEAAEEERLEQLEKSQRAERRLQTIQQATSLATASAKVLAQLGFAGIPAVAIMLAAFASAKIRASRLARKENRKGTFEILGGGKHGSGNDTDLGFSANGQRQFAEQNEGIAVFAADKVAKYRDVLPDLVQSINNGTYEKRFGALGEAVSDYRINISSEGGSDMSETNNHLRAIKKQGEERVYFENGKKRVQYKNRMTIFE